MKKHYSEIHTAINALLCKIQKQWGHKFLYKDFCELVAKLDKKGVLSDDEVSSLDELVKSLLCESEEYSLGFPYHPYYPLWSTRCLECAAILIEYIPMGYAQREERIEKKSELMNAFVSHTILSEFVRTELYKKYVEYAVGNNQEILWKLALNCYQISSDGRRPRDPEEELKLFDMMAEGYQLSINYIELSGDYSPFPKWFSVLSPMRTMDLLDESTDYYEHTKRRWFDKVVKCFEKTLDLQLSLLGTWLDGDANGFVEFWGDEKIEELLELVDDDTFHDVLRRLSLLKDNLVVEKVLRYYAEDQEPQVRNFALELLSSRNNK